MKKGFTLIELLAVIVILAVIALIATPMILNVVETAKKGSAESSANGYLEALENYQVMQQVTNATSSLFNNTKTVEELNNYANIKGEKPTKGHVTFDNGKVVDYQLQFDEYLVKYDATNKKATASKEEYAGLGFACPPYSPGTEVTLSDGSEWYVISDEGGGCTTVTLLSKYNINITTNKQDSTLTGAADDVNAVQYDDGSRNNANNTYCQISADDGNYYGCNAYSAVEGIYNEGTSRVEEDGTLIPLYGTVTEDSLIKKYIDSYVATLNLGNNLVSSGLMTNNNFDAIGCARQVTAYDDQGNFAGATVIFGCENGIHPWISSTNYWTDDKLFGTQIGYSFAMDTEEAKVRHGVPVNEKSGVRPVITINKAALN